MAVERMKFISITGDEKNLDSIIANELIGSGIQPENALKVLEKGWKLTYLTYDSSIKEYIKKAEKLLEKINVQYQNKYVKLERRLEEIKDNVEKNEQYIENTYKEIEENKNEIEKLEKAIVSLGHIKKLDIDLQKLYDLHYMKFRFGKMSNENYQELDIKNLDVVVIELEKTQNDTWLIYFTPETITEKIDSYFKVMKFERVWLPSDISGKPSELLEKVKMRKEECNNIVQAQTVKLMELKENTGKELIEDISQLNILEKVNKVKKYMAHDNKGVFYIVGWIPINNLETLLPKLEKYDVKYVIKSHDEVASVPPTKLKNNRIVRPFESIVKMYGTPNYTEMDPTTFVAITAFLMFGFMFGDVGQGAIILLIGLILSKKKSSIGPVLTAGGVSAIIFGVLYGSVFGKEDIIKGILPSPMENITNMLIAGIATGAILIIIAMIFNIKNGITTKDKGRILFDKNGLAGLIFYVTVLIIIIGLLVNGKMILSLSISLALIIIPLLLILFKEKIENAINKNKEKEKVSIVEKIFEIIEMLLSMASNTISFVRLAAFAINHVGLCMAVYILGDMVGGAGSLVVAIIGNIIVIALEGLIVAIQVLRLEYYELFSRFYTGDGKDYIPIEEQEN